MLTASLLPLLPVLTPGFGAVAGAWGARRNGVRFRDERALWIAGAALGATIAALAGEGLARRFGAAAGIGAVVGSALWLAGSLLGAWWTPALDAHDRPLSSAASVALKTLQSPLLSVAGLLLAALFAIVGRRVTLQHGTVFVSAGRGGAAVTLGAVVWAQDGLRDARGRVSDTWARHEALHARAVASLGEAGFYLAYVFLAAPWALLRHAPWNALASDGRGNPFERTAYALHTDPPAPHGEPLLASRQARA